jgi:hypothetical protein
MARYRGTVAGSRGDASRLGTAASGLRVTCNGWKSGVCIIARDDNGDDVFDVYMTAGSDGTGRKVFIGRIVEDDGDVAFMPEPWPAMGHRLDNGY